MVSNLAMAKAMTEDELLEAITQAATIYGWRWFHIRRSDKALQMGHAGFPDLVLARGGVLLVWELKAHKGLATSDQLAWLEAFIVAGVECEVIRPADLDRALRLLR